MSIFPAARSITVTGCKTGLTHHVQSIEDLERLLRDGDLDPDVFSFSGGTVTAFQPAWEDKFPKSTFAFSKKWKELTKPFYTVYEGVTAEMRAYYKREPNSHLFLEYIIEKFFDEYEEWPKPGTFANRYLNQWHKYRKGPAYRLIGQAFLHIAWDLPRVVAEGFPMGAMEKLRISEADAGEHFRATNDLFEGVLYQNFKDPNVSGVLAAGGKVLKPRSKLLNQVFFWIVAVRTDAWVLGCDLAKQDVLRQTKIKKALENAITKSELEAQEGPFGWMGLLKPPILSFFSFVPFALWPVWTRWGLLVLICVAVLYLAGSVYCTFEPTARVANRFGQRLHVELGILSRRVRNPEDGFKEVFESEK